VVDEKDSIPELFKAWASTSWATALFGAGQLGRAFGGGRTAEGFESLTKAVESQLDGGTRMIFQTGDRLQRGLWDATYSALTGDANAPRLAFKSALDAAECAAAAVSALVPERGGRLAWLELRNKLEAFNLFAHADLALGIARPGTAALAELVERASSLGPYRSVWAKEGVGHLYAESRRSDEFDARGETLPSSCLIALHAGAGLSFAARCLERLTPRSDGAEFRRALEEFFALCRGGSREGYAEAAFEALGLAARNLHPQLLPGIDRCLAAMDEDLIAYFWHGVGRGIYFAPTNFLPDGGAFDRAVEEARREPPHETGRVNALAGLVWAFVLVNIRHPELLESLLLRHASALGEGGALTNGLCSAVVVWRDSSPDDESIGALCRHRPADARLDELWEARISRPAEEAARRYHLVLKEHGYLGGLFRHRPLDDLVAYLELAATADAP
jgi:hypothetical protein